MGNKDFDIKEDVLLYYYNKDIYRRNHLMWELLANADRVINSVYIFKHFEEYCKQLNSDKPEDKNEIYWNVSYYEKLIDYIKIIVAFETMNKALLLRSGILIHKIDHSYNKKLHKRQSDGFPITIQEFFINNYTDLDWIRREAKLNGLVKNYSTINFSHTLNREYQKILKFDNVLVQHLVDINQKRNRLHLYSDFKGAFRVDSHIKKWKFIKEASVSKIRNELLLIEDELKKLS